MDTSMTRHLKTALDTDQNILDEFNSRYIAKLEQIQQLKTEQFEHKVKIDELSKTLDVYSFKTSAGHNVFSPFSVTATSQEEKASQIEQTLHSLKKEYQSLDAQIRMLEKDANHLKERIVSIHQAIDALQHLHLSIDKAIAAAKEAAAAESAKEPEDTGSSAEAILQAERRLLSARMTSELKPQLSGICRKLELLSWLMKSDVNRANVTLTELNDAAADLTKSLDALIYDLSEDTETMKGPHKS